MPHDDPNRRTFLAAVLGGVALPMLVADPSLAQDAVEPLPDDSNATDRDRELIARTYELARSAVTAGDHPFGALLVHDGKIIAESKNTVETANDVTKHAETSLVSFATHNFDRQTLANSILYSSTEPCVMCTGAVERARIRRLVYGTTARHIATILGSPYSGMPSREILRRIEPNMEVVGPVSENEGIPIHAAFWPGFIQSRRRG